MFYDNLSLKNAKTEHTLLHDNPIRPGNTNERGSRQMAIEVRLDMMLVKKKMTLTELSERIGISITNLSLLKTGKVKGIRFSTLDAICRELECHPGDILDHIPEFV
jgi:putative transcriptional regulator